MADKSFALPPSQTGFDRYVDIVKEILSLHNRIMNAIYDTTASGGSSLTNIQNAIKVISDLTNTSASGPTGYNIDVNGETQITILPGFDEVSKKITEGYARKTAENIVLSSVRAIQTHLVDLINESTTYSDINDYYSQNQTYRNSTDNILNGGYHFTSDWNRLSTKVGVPYSSNYDIN